MPILAIEFDDEEFAQLVALGVNMSNLWNAAPEEMKQFTDGRIIQVAIEMASDLLNAFGGEFGSVLVTLERGDSDITFARVANAKNSRLFATEIYEQLAKELVDQQTSEKPVETTSPEPPSMTQRLDADMDLASPPEG